MMKKNYAKISLLFLSLWVTAVAFTQENSISPIFSLTENAGSTVNTIASINQKTGKTLAIEDFATESYFAKNFTVSTLGNSNVDKIFFLKNNNNLAVYELPYFFDPNYNGEKEELIVSNNITDIDYHHNSGYLYAYDLLNENLFTISSTDGVTNNNTAIPFTSGFADFSIETTNNFVVLNGKDMGTISLLFYDISANTHTSINLSTDYTELNLVGNQHFSKLYAVAKDLNDKHWLLEINPADESVNTIGELPSCIDCFYQDYTYDKNALALDWENNELLLILSQNISGTSNHFLMTFDLSNAEKLYSGSLEKRYSNLYFNKASSDLVFPGDTNHDGVVDSKDLFSIGLKYSFNTIARFTQNAEWIGQHSFNTGVIKQGVDVKHADCNGDGVIDTDDIEVIKSNYSYIHNSNKSSQITSSDCDYPLAFSFPNNAYSDNDVTIYIKLGETTAPVTDVYGVDFTVEYNKDFVVPGSMKTVQFNSWFGVDGNNFNRVDFDDHPNGTIDINVTGNDLLNRTGGGDIIALSWTMEDLVMPIANPSAIFDLKISNITIINLNEDILESCGVDTSLVVYQKDETVNINTINNNTISIYPNPAQNYINIESDEKLDIIELYSITGKLIKTVQPTKSNSIDISTFAKGVYYLKIHTKENAYLDKIIVE